MTDGHPPFSLPPAAPFIVILNGGSGSTGADERIALLEAIFQGAGRSVRFQTVDNGGELPAIAERACQDAKAQGGAVVAAGGDGTLNAIAQAAIKHDCVFGALPQGTFNYFGRAQGIPQDIEDAAHALLRARIEPVQVGLVNGRVFLVNASLGLYPRLLEDREAYKRQLGRSRWVAMVSGVMTLLRERRQLVLDIETGGERQSLRTPTLFIGNNGLQFERIGLDEDADAITHGELAAVAVQPTRTASLFGLALRGALGRLGDAEHLRHFAFRRLTVRVHGQRRLKIATDGEIQWLNSPLVFEVSPRPLRLLRPLEAHRVDPA